MRRRPAVWSASEKHKQGTERRQDMRVVEVCCTMIIMLEHSAGTNPRKKPVGCLELPTNRTNQPLNPPPPPHLNDYLVVLVHQGKDFMENLFVSHCN